jgi:hypothetical protein
MAAGQALVIVLIALLIGLLVNAADILRTAERQPQGWRRTIALAVIEPIAGLSATLWIDRPRRLIDRALGREAEAPPTEATAVTTTTTTAAPAGAVTTEPRVVTAVDPLRMFIGGDSMVGQFGPMLANAATEDGLVEVTEVVYEFSSGLTRPDFVDWPARLRRVVREQDPEVLVLVFGGNDAQAIRMGGKWVDFGTPEWETEYRSRVGGLMQELVESGRRVYWVGMPIVRSEEFRAKVAVMNEVYESEAARFEEVHFVDGYPVFVGPDGGYAEYLPDANGDLVDMRLNDGIHLTTAGAIRLAAVVFDQISRDWNLPVGG